MIKLGLDIIPHHDSAKIEEWKIKICGQNFRHSICRIDVVLDEREVFAVFSVWKNYKILKLKLNSI